MQSPQWMTTARVLRRAGFGATGTQIDAVAGQDLSAYLDQVLAADPERDPGALATPMPQWSAPPPAPGRTATRAARVQYNQMLAEDAAQLSSWWVRRMVAVHQPLHEKLTLLWHNHFATSAAKVRVASYMAAQNQKLRTLSLGDFRTLAFAMLTDAAMLRWLDGQSNTAKAANENLSREFMELFALGHGNGYTEDDVRQGARALTGWTIDRTGSTRLVAKRHDAAQKTLLGVTGNLGADDYCDIVLAQPNSARYVAGRLWQQLATDAGPSPAALDRAVTAYGSQRNLAALTKSILTDPEFLGSTNTVVSTPVEWLVGVLRSLNVAVDSGANAKTVVTALKTLGQQPFYPPDVGGWPHGQPWLSTATAGVRLRTATALAKAADLSTIDQASVRDRLDATGFLIGVGAWTDRSAAALAPLAKDPPQLLAAAVNTPEYLTS
ncbi:DUF1800 domain-containing protein [Mycolicibacterium sp. 050158]|uniref:DUF1800 domain-containing protein n=1 Tax=Mycolicibacterium sp. 050158 TaxID=3090602 RepID=UPI00299E8A23|nr:DUF1800 domain-containing protein [Mycolicibacterium sp. 050158]MDX1888128.1 DUF1800 domain-containing protein [Mycolicibacterium sp. 050158]